MLSLKQWRVPLLSGLIILALIALFHVFQGGAGSFRGAGAAPEERQEASLRVEEAEGKTEAMLGELNSQNQNLQLQITELKGLISGVAQNLEAQKETLRREQELKERELEERMRLQQLQEEQLKEKERQEAERARDGHNPDQHSEAGSDAEHEAAIVFPHGMTVRERLELLNRAEPHNLQHVYERLQYWSLKPYPRLPDPGVQFLTFRDDCGGLNNVRISFEVVMAYAWVTRRTVVLPPAGPFYLIDYGQIVRDGPDSKGTTTYFSDFFDMEALAAAVPIITSEEFIATHGERLGAPPEILSNELWHRDYDLKNRFFEWLLDPENGNSVSAPWGPIPNVLAWPNEQRWREAGKPTKTFVANRKVREYTQDMKEKAILNFPRCKAPPGVDPKLGSLTYRYLGQVATSIGWAEPDFGVGLRWLLRDHLRYRPEVFEIAARVIAHLGIYRYSSMHIRRNELQYKKVFLNASEILANTQELLNEREVLYIATDEVDPRFLDDIKSKHEVFQWADFFTARGGNVLVGVDIPRQIVGPIEQLICSGGRVFFGTWLSTFTSYIHRLRGYTNAPVQNLLTHTVKNTKADFVLNSKQDERPGTEYLSEHQSLWSWLEQIEPRYREMPVLEP